MLTDISWSWKSYHPVCSSGILEFHCCFMQIIYRTCGTQTISSGSQKVFFWCPVLQFILEPHSNYIFIYWKSFARDLLITIKRFFSQNEKACAVFFFFVHTFSAPLPPCNFIVSACTMTIKNFDSDILLFLCLHSVPLAYSPPTTSK